MCWYFHIFLDLTLLSLSRQYSGFVIDFDVNSTRCEINLTMQEESLKHKQIWRPFDVHENLNSPIVKPYEQLRYKHFSGLCQTNSNILSSCTENPNNTLTNSNSDNISVIIDLSKSSQPETSSEFGKTEIIETHRTVRELSRLHSVLQPLHKNTIVTKTLSDSDRSDAIVQNYDSNALPLSQIDQNETETENESVKKVPKKRTRTTFNATQMKTLLAAYSKNDHLKESGIIDLSKQLSMDVKVIKRWFHNHRQKVKRKKVIDEARDKLLFDKAYVLFGGEYISIEELKNNSKKHN